MASTIQLQGTINWAQSFVDFTTLNIGTANEPALTNANTVLQTILGPPFKWNFNRAMSTNFTTAVGTQDYLVPIGNYGYLEAASVKDASNKVFAIKEIKNELTLGSETGRPQSMAAQLDNNAGTITFRVLPVPDAVYTITPYYQMGASLFTALTGTWAPIPDRYSYIYNYGFLALTMAYDDDIRFPMFNQKFIAHLLGAQQGLSETERNMFLETWNLMTRQQQLVGMKDQQGRQALGT